MSYNFEIAKSVLSDKDKDRILCLYLNCEPSAINWEKATKDFGAASVESMRVMTRSALKKIADAGGKEGVDAKPAKVGGRKRKDNGETVGDAKDPKIRGKKAKKDISPVDDDSAADGEGGVKQEEAE